MKEPTEKQPEVSAVRTVHVTVEKHEPVVQRVSVTVTEGNLHGCGYPYIPRVMESPVLKEDAQPIESNPLQHTRQIDFE